MKATWIAKKCNIRYETLVCGGVNEEIEWDVRNQKEVVDSVPFSNR